MIPFSLYSKEPKKEESEKKESGRENRIREGQGSTLKEDKPNYFETAKLIMDSINNNIFLNSNRLFENLIHNYKLSKKLLGVNFLERLTGYDEKYLSKNINIPEFQRELKKKIDEKIDELKDEKLIDKNDNITDNGYELAAISLVIDELSELNDYKEGRYRNKRKMEHGVVRDFKEFKSESYKNIAIRKTIRTALKRLHKEIIKADLKAVIRSDKAGINIVYAIDASGSMKGEKIEQAKKAGVALAYRAIKDKNKVGLVIFQEKVVKEIPLTNDFELLAKSLVGIRAKQQTEIAQTILKSIDLLSRVKTKGSKHLFIITDAIPTKGETPVEDALKASSIASSNKIRISIIGIKLNEEAEKLARRITEMTEGRLYRIMNTNRINKLDTIILSEYDKILT